MAVIGHENIIFWKPINSTNKVLAVQLSCHTRQAHTWIEHGRSLVVGKFKLSLVFVCSEARKFDRIGIGLLDPK